MHELDDRQDQAMTALKVALANLAMWARDRYFPAAYARATWARLAPFFRLPGRVVGGPDVVTVELRPFNDRRLAGDLAALCARVAEAAPRLPDGRCCARPGHGGHLAGASLADAPAFRRKDGWRTQDSP